MTETSGFDLFELGSDTEAPYLRNRDPASGQTGVDRTTNIFFEIYDTDSDVDPATIVVSVNPGTGLVLAYDATDVGSEWKNGYTGSVVEALDAGKKYYQVTIDIPGTELPWNQVVSVSVIAQDVNTNEMNQGYSFTTIADTLAPVIYDWSPTGTYETVDVPVFFRITDVDSGIDEDTLNVTIGGVDAVVAGVAEPGYSLAKVGDAVNLAVTVGHPNLDPLTTYAVVVDVSDLEANPATESWSFDTGDRGFLQTPILSATAGDSRVLLNWTLPPPEDMRQDRFDLRRSLSGYPTSPDEGELVYSGTARTYTDTDVVNGTVYYYTVFVVVGDGDLFLDYEEPASAQAKPREVPVAVVGRYDEYVPARGDFGAKTSKPIPSATIEAVWGQKSGDGIRYTDLLRTVAGKPVHSPVRGTVTKIEDSDLSTADTRLKRVEISAESGIALVINGFVPWASVVVGANLEAGQALGRTSTGNAEFGIWKPSGEGFGLRTIRTRYFYLTTEDRDGRL